MAEAEPRIGPDHRRCCCGLAGVHWGGDIEDGCSCLEAGRRGEERSIGAAAEAGRSAIAYREEEGPGEGDSGFAHRSPGEAGLLVGIAGLRGTVGPDTSCCDEQRNKDGEFEGVSTDGLIVNHLLGAGPLPQATDGNLLVNSLIFGRLIKRNALVKYFTGH